MARLFDGVDQRLGSGSVAWGFAGDALTFSAWCYPISNLVNQYIWNSETSGGVSHVFWVGDTGRLTVTIVTSATSGQAYWNSVLGTGAYQHLCYRWSGSVTSMTTADVDLYVDGTFESVDGGTNGSGTVNTIDSHYIAGRTSDNARNFNGRVAEAGLWNVELSAPEIEALASGYSPLFIRPESLVEYWPIIGRTSPEIEIIGGYDMTLTNAPTVAAHPPVIYPSSYQPGLTIPQTGDALLLES